MVSCFQWTGHSKSKLKVGELGSECAGIASPVIRIPKCLVLLLFRVLGNIDDLQVLIVAF
jgi:hypothetical protein